MPNEFETTLDHANKLGGDIIQGNGSGQYIAFLSFWQKELTNGKLSEAKKLNYTPCDSAYRQHVYPFVSSDGSTLRLNYNSVDHYFGKEEIVFRILNCYDGKLFLLSEKALLPSNDSGGITAQILSSELSKTIKQHYSPNVLPSKVDLPIAHYKDGTYTWGNYETKEEVAFSFSLSGNPNSTSGFNIGGSTSELNQTLYGFDSLDPPRAVVSRQIKPTDLSLLWDPNAVNCCWITRSMAMDDMEKRGIFYADRDGQITNVLKIPQDKLFAVPALNISLENVFFASAASGKETHGKFSEIIPDEEGRYVSHFRLKNDSTTKAILTNQEDTLFYDARDFEKNATLVICSQRSGEKYYEYTCDISGRQGNINLSNETDFRAWVESKDSNDGSVTAYNLCQKGSGGGSGNGGSGGSGSGGKTPTNNPQTGLNFICVAIISIALSISAANTLSKVATKKSKHF
ncbi:MAG: hypothetical protein LBP36_01965 [Oscillospiraceae bacterium]|nr:hypothetical protein [Oscillospiraceae bacterium]